VALVRGGAPLSAEPQNEGEAEAEGDAPARYRALVMSAAKKVEKVALKVLLG